MAEETKKTYTIRLPEQMAARVEAQAASMNITPTTLLQSLVVRHLGGAHQGGADNAPLVALCAKLEAVRKACGRRSLRRARIRCRVVRLRPLDRRGRASEFRLCLSAEH